MADHPEPSLDPEFLQWWAERAAREYETVAGDLNTEIATPAEPESDLGSK